MRQIFSRHQDSSVNTRLRTPIQEQSLEASRRSSQMISLTDLETSKNYNHITQRTPRKPETQEQFDSPQQHSSLRDSIMNRLQNSYSKPRLSSSKYQSHKNINTASNKSAYYLSDSKAQPSHTQPAYLQTQESELRDIVVSMQSPLHQGFYDYPSWLKLHDSVFPNLYSGTKFNQVSTNPANELWKVMRLVSFGEVLIASGLIYEVIKVIKMRCTPESKQIYLMECINNFLKGNSLDTATFTLKELNTYKPLVSILQPYCSVDHTESPKRQQSKKKSQRGSSRKKESQDSKDVFQSLYLEAKLRSDRKLVASALKKESGIQECTFSPSITEYRSKESGPALKQSRHSKHSQLPTELIRSMQEESQMRFDFRARPVDRNILEVCQEVKGVTEHVERAMKGLQKKLKKQKQQPIYYRVVDR